MNCIFGPVPSRRLGLSLGVDLVPYKTCSYDCIYCSLGKTTKKTIVRKEYIKKDLIIKQLREHLSRLVTSPDYITLSGSGEPTLNIKIGDVIREIKQIAPIPVAVLTNASLLPSDQMKEELLAADVLLPSLDAVSPQVFTHVNRPEPSLNINNIIQGLIDFRRQFSGEIWLECLFCRAINDDHAEVAKMKEKMEEIKPDRVQLNTVVRPPAEDFAHPLNEGQLLAISKELGIEAEVIPNSVCAKKPASFTGKEETILNLITRRPCTCEDICNALGLHNIEALKCLHTLVDEGRVRYRLHHRRGYYEAVNR